LIDSLVNQKKGQVHGLFVMLPILSVLNELETIARSELFRAAISRLPYIGSKTLDSIDAGEHYAYHIDISFRSEDSFIKTYTMIDFSDKLEMKIPTQTISSSDYCGDVKTGELVTVNNVSYMFFDATPYFNLVSKHKKDVYANKQGSVSYIVFANGEPVGYSQLHNMPAEHNFDGIKLTAR
jgi:hypothetical protein